VRSDAARGAALLLIVALAGCGSADKGDRQPAEEPYAVLDNPPADETPLPFPDAVPEPAAVAGDDVHFRYCREARAAGVAPLQRGDPGYAPHLDRDGDGVACEPAPVGG
jgi:hypothetical protein